MRTMLSSFGFVCLLIYAGAQSFTCQGLLKENGIPANAPYDFEFRLFNAVSGGTQVGPTLTVNDLTVQNGLFTVELNFGSAWDGSDRYLEIRVRPGPSTGSYTILTPRVKITRAPYAARADAAPPIGAAGGDLSGTYPNPTVVRLQERTVSSAAPSTGQVLKWDGSAWSPAADLRDAFWQASGNHIFYAAGNVGVGTSSPSYPLDVRTSGGVAIYGLTTATSGITSGVYGLSSSTDGRGVVGLANATSGGTYGVYGQSNSTSGYGVFGYATATSGGTYGVYGLSYGTSGYGVFGYAAATSGTTSGVYGLSYSTGGRGVVGLANATSGSTYGVYGLSYSSSGIGVLGSATAASGSTYGVYGRSASPSGTGVYGAHEANTGSTPGVHGITYSTESEAVGVLGEVYSTSPGASSAGVRGINRGTGSAGIGVWGSQDGSGYGVYGVSVSGAGVAGRATAASGTTYGVWGRSDSPDGYGGYFVGRGYFSGNVGIGTTPLAHRLVVNSPDTNTLRLIGPGSFGSTAKLNFGDADFVYLQEDADDNLTIYAHSRTAIMGGNVGIGTTAPAVKLHVNGTARVKVLEIEGADFAEKFPTTDEVEPGMVMEIDPDNPGHLRKARGAYNKRVVGVVAGANGLSKGIVLGNLEGSENHTPIAMSGRVWVYADATDRAIEPGDFLTTAEKPGYAMAVDDLAKAQGAILGKAMTRLEKGKAGLVLVVVNLQ